MIQLTPDGRRKVDELARRLGFSSDAVAALLDRLASSGGTMAQFDHPELGGMGQWSRGGMIMIGDMFNNMLKARVDELARELAALLDQHIIQPATTPSAMGMRQGTGWWPAELGVPASTGQQNEMRYAYFPAARRLVVDIDGVRTIYDTLEHHIGGVSQQQQGMGGSVIFASQLGPVRLSDLPVVAGSGPAAAAPTAAEPAAHTQAQTAAPSPAQFASQTQSQSSVSAPPQTTSQTTSQSTSQSTPKAASPAATKSDTATETPTPPAAAAAGPAVSPSAVAQPVPAAPTPVAAAAPVAGAISADDCFAKIERLAELRAKGILSEEEFSAKKAELLARI